MVKSQSGGRIKNMGPKTSQWLLEIGIDSIEGLEALGAVEAFRRLRASRPHQVSLNALWALQGAILNIHWNALPPDMKDELRAQVESDE